MHGITLCLRSVVSAMLGGTVVFDGFSDSGFDDVVAALLNTTLFLLLTIVIVNLLVAVLSTEPASIDHNADQEYKVGHGRGV